MLSRSQFDAACKAFIAKHSGWVWNEHLSIPGLGYMSRTAIHSRRQPPPTYVDDSEEDVTEEDATVCHASVPHETLTSRQYVVYSASFQVPAFYFTIHDSNGSPLPLSDLLETSLFRPFAFPGTEATSFALSLPTSSFPLLSQGDHPTLGTPCWYLHPCETSASVDEIMAEVREDGWSEEQILVRWLEAWFMVVSNAINLNI